jgi:hypothetical protein
MRLWLAIAALSTTLLTAPLLAQMHGGPRGGGSIGGASMGRGGFSSHGSAGFRGGSSFGSSPHFGSAPQFGAAFGTGLRQPSLRTRGSFARGSFGGFRQPVFGSRHFHHRAFFGSVFPGYYGYYGYPAYYGGSFYSTPDYYPGYDYYGASYSAPSYSAQNGIVQQQQDIERLEDEVARLREQRETQPQAREAPGPQTETPSQSTLLVFRDKHTQEVGNYAIVGGTLWIFSEQRATKLPLSWLDLEATAKANDDRGVNFQVPK